MNIQKIISQAYYKYVEKNYVDPVGVILTHEQMNEVLMSYGMINHNEILSAKSGTARVMGMLAHIERPEVDMSDWLFYNSRIDVRNINE